MICWSPTRSRCSAWLGLIAVLASAPSAAQTPRELAAARDWLVETELATAGVKQPAVLAAMREVPRHEFVPAELRRYAYLDTTLPIGHGQTISPPYIVAWMTENLEPRPTDRILEIGTGSGYQAAVLSRLAKDVYTIEIEPALVKSAQQHMERVGYKNVHMRAGDGFLGWPEAAPFDRIIVTCSPEKVPAPLAEQLREGGRMLIPIGEGFQQNLCLLTKQNGQLKVTTRMPTYFVPMTGKADALRSPPESGPLTSLVNGDFEDELEPGVPAAWYYVRQATLERSVANGPPGKCVHFNNRVAGRRSLLMQSIGVDGKRVQRLNVSMQMKAADIRPAKTDDPHDGAKMLVSFFNADRKTVGEKVIGPWRDSFDWRREVSLVDVPPDAVGAAIAIGLFGVTGDLWCDKIDVRAESSTKSAQKR